MEWHFDDNMPIYTQLVYQIKFAIVSGELSPGERMAGVRDLAADAGVNPNTMQRAQQRPLHHRGHRRHRRGQTHACAAAYRTVHGVNEKAGLYQGRNHSAA